jgi:hypothetical protein
MSSAEVKDEWSYTSTLSHILCSTQRLLFKLVLCSMPNLWKNIVSDSRVTITVVLEAFSRQSIRGH